MRIVLFALSLSACSVVPTRVEAHPPTCLDRADLDAALDGATGRLGRAFLHRGPDGAFDGYRVAGILGGSLPDRLGVRNGDIVHAIDGRALTSMEAGLEALTASRGADRVVLELTRGGEPHHLTIEIREACP